MSPPQRRNVFPLVLTPGAFIIAPTPLPAPPMRLRVARLPQARTWPSQGVAAVIDVLRATTVITRAIDAGAATVAVCGEIDEALELAAAAQPRPLLCGERFCQPIEGFDLGNSPAEYHRERVAGKNLLMTTTNGTRAVLAAAGFDAILAASFNNLAAVVRYLAGQPEVSLICAGTDGEPTEEDLLLAGAIVHMLAVDGAATDLAPLGPSEQEVLALWRDHLASARSLAERLRTTLGAQNLLASGFAADIAACAAIDTTDAQAIIDPRAGLVFRRHNG